MEVREGVQEGLAQNECVNRAPSRAIRENTGVWSCSQDWSSANASRILGRE